MPLFFATVLRSQRSFLEVGDSDERQVLVNDAREKNLRANITLDVNHFVDAGIWCIDLEHLLDLFQFPMHGAMAIARNQYDTMDLFLEGWNPSGIKSLSRRSTFVTKVLRTGKHSDLEGLVSNLVIDSNLHEQWSTGQSLFIPT